MSLAIEVKNLCFSYRRSKTPALSDLNYEQIKGDAVGLVGRAGAGKSSFLFSLTRIIPEFFKGNYSGEIKILGESISGKKSYQLCSKIGIVLQDFESQLFSTRAELDVAFGLENLGLERKEISKRVDDALESVRMTHLRHRDPSTLSGGEKQRLAIASVLAIGGQILTFDEATTDLDPKGRGEVNAIIRALKEKGHSLIIVEHEPEELMVSDKIVLLGHGKVIAEGDTKDFLKETKLLEENGIRPPEVCELFSLLGLNSSVLDPEKGAKELKKQGFELNENERRKLEQEEIKEEKERGALVLQAVNLHFSYEPEKPILQNINLDIRDKDFLAIIGQNGSGKTTLVKHLMGLLKPKEGEIFLDGKSLAGKKIQDIAKEVGFVFQNPDHQIFCSRVYEEVSFAPRNFKFSEKEIKERTMEALKLVELEGKLNEDPLSLTKGERQRLAIASVLAQRPRVIILDEPTTGLDYIEQLKIMDMLKSLNQKGHTIVIITHTLWLVARYAKRAIVLKDGIKILEGPVRDVLSDKNTLENASLICPKIVKLGLEFGFPILSPKEGKRLLRRAR